MSGGVRGAALGAIKGSLYSNRLASINRKTTTMATETADSDSSLSLSLLHDALYTANESLERCSWELVDSSLSLY